MFDFNELEDKLAAEFEDIEDTEDTEEETEEEVETETDEVTTEEDEVETETEEVETDLEEEDDDEIVPVDDEDTKPVKVVKPTPEEKRRYAFEKLRKESAEAKREKARLEQERKELEDIAVAYGYKSYTEMVEALREEKIKKEAAKNNMDVNIYKRVYESEQKVQKLEQEREAERRLNKLNSFVATFDKFLETNGLTEVDKEDILANMEEDGYTLEDLIQTKKPETLIKAYAVDKLKEKAVRDALVKKSTKEKLKETKLTDTGKVTESDDLDKMLSDYFKNNANKNY